MITPGQRPHTASAATVPPEASRRTAVPQAMLRVRLKRMRMPCRKRRQPMAALQKIMICIPGRTQRAISSGTSSRPGTMASNKGV